MVNQNIKNKKVIVLLGGNSNESEISKKTGEAIYNSLLSLPEIKHVEKYYLTHDYEAFLIFLLKNKNDIVIFNALHGKIGEDGRIQGLLDILKIPYTHSGVLVSSLCMNKILTKQLAKDIVNVALDQILYKNEYDAKFVKINYPLVIKPVDEGSSVGIYLANNPQEFNDNIAKVANFEKIMLEEYLKGEEYTVGVLNNKALAITQIIPKNIFYDYESKYAQGGSVHIVPAKLESKIYDEMLSIAEKLFTKLGAKSCFRVDFIISNDTIYLLEINTQPGMTSTSLLPEQALHCGINFANLCKEILNTAWYDD
jgi:D-alanine-D-alanine ligase